MIKFGIRQNMRYPVNLVIWSFLRNVEIELIYKFFSLKSTLIYMPLMFLGEFLFGLILYLYEKIIFMKNKNTNRNNSFMGIKLIIQKESIQSKDELYKIIILIILIAFYDFMQFVLNIETGSIFNRISDSFAIRLNGILILFDALFYYYILRFHIFRHQILSIVIITICLLLVIGTEFIFQDINIFLSYSRFVLLLGFILLIQLFNSPLDLIEKYLFEYNYINPFLTLLLEGCFGLIFSVIYFLYKNIIPTVEPNNNSEYFYVLVILLCLYMILSGFKNGYRIITNKIYSPMTSTLELYFLNPLYITYYFILGDDFISNGEINYIYYFINLFLSIIISLCGLVYNEFLILFFCGLEHETHKQISERSNFEKLTELTIPEDLDTILA